MGKKGEVDLETVREAAMMTKLRHPNVVSADPNPHPHCHNVSFVIFTKIDWMKYFLGYMHF